jgi:hypothetical protein
MKKLLVFFVALVMAFAALPAFAQDKADWSFYGSVRMWTAWESVKAETPAILSGTGAAPFLGQYAYQGFANAQRWINADGNYEGDAGLAWELQGNSRIGANVKWGNVSGAFEYSSTPGLRLLYGTWNFGPGSLRVGQDYTPWFFVASGLCGPGGGECNGIGFGTPYGGRQPQLKLIFGGFNVALVRPYNLATLYQINNAATNVDVFNATTNPGGLFVTATPADVDREWPKFEASYTLTAGPVALWMAGVYQKVTYVTNLAGNPEVDIDSWQLGLGAKTAFGPFYLNGLATYAQNPNNYAGYANLLPTFSWVDATAQHQEDAGYWAFQLIPGFKVTDSLSFEGGIILQTSKINVPASIPEVELKQTSWVYYVQMTWSPAKNVYIIPELGVIDYKKLQITGDDDVDLGKTTWFGIKWQINF